MRRTDNKCTLIATLPSVSNMSNVEKVFKNEFISEVRFNTGGANPYPPREILKILNDFATRYHKKLLVDIKGRQLRVAKWADPMFECIELNHKIHPSTDIEAIFRNGNKVKITHIIEGNKIFVSPLPREALGAGQSVNIVPESYEVEGYLTDKDKEYLQTCNELGIKVITASFIESFYDLKQILDIHPNAEIIAKIESIKGMNFISGQKINFRLMAARDDLYIQCGQNINMFNCLKTIINKDKDAICASRIFMSLEKHEKPDFADFADLILMYNMGYRKFMLCDNVCNYRFDEALNAWKEFLSYIG